MIYHPGPVDGIHRSSLLVQHRNEEYEQAGFETLWAMQEKHFWYRGRHRFLLAALDRFQTRGSPPWAGVDLGGGVGGWVRYLADRRSSRFTKLALADSSETALTMAGDVLPASVERYQIDLMNLGWEAQWDCAFLLDVIEHLPDDVQAMRQAAHALKAGGYLFVTTPALRQFWSYNDELIHHLRRYNRRDYATLAEATGLELCDARYFMFLLSPLYWLARTRKGIEGMNEKQKTALMNKTHQVPPPPINGMLSAVFAAETPLGHWLRFPWGTSILGIFRKP
jgi:SAM-dependent methyltransferase